MTRARIGRDLCLTAARRGERLARRLCGLGWMSSVRATARLPRFGRGPDLASYGWIFDPRAAFAFAGPSM